MPPLSMPRKHLWSVPALVGLLVLLGFAGRASAQPTTALPARPGISVSGPNLVQNGMPWVPRGVQIVGLVAPNSSLAGKYIPANQHFGAPELAQALADHSDVVRFQVSEFGLNPTDPLYDPGYASEVQQGIELARSLGLDVIVSLQAEIPAGNELRCPLPDAGAATDWQELGAMFGSDPDIMFELYNEPGVAATPANWQVWKNGGTVFNGRGPCTAVGMQSLVDQIRAGGADNVIILPGLAGEQSLAGQPTITDPAFPHDPQLAYGIHYPNLTQTPDEWDTEFGDAAAREPVIVTEWQANGTTNCVANSPVKTPLLLSYLALKQIGVIGFAFDLPGTIVSDYTYAPTTYADFACGAFTGGAGQTLFADYAGEAAQASASATTTAAPSSWLLATGALGQMDALDAATTVRTLDTPRTFVLGGDSVTLAEMGMSAATPAEAFTSETALATAAGDGSLRSGTAAVVLELGPSSPTSEQHHPAQTFALAAQVAHRDGLLFVAAPQIGLVKALSPHSRPIDQNLVFLKRDIAGMAAASADALVLPFANVQGHSVGYADVTSLAARQAHAAHRGIQIIGGLEIGGTRGQGGIPLAASARATATVVTGYSLAGQPSADNTSPIALLQQLYGP